MDRLNLYILTFNCARNLIQTDRFASHLFDVLPQSDTDLRGSASAPELLVLSLQEIAPIAYAFLGGSFLVPYFDAFRSAVDLAVTKRWPDDDIHYVNIATENCALTGIMVFVRLDIVAKVSWVETAEVGVGVQEMGNKGAVGVRLGYLNNRYDDTVDLTVVAAHLAPMEDAFNRRNTDWKSIVERLVFSQKELRGEALRTDGPDEQDEGTALLQNPRPHQSGIFTPLSHLFLAGDLNYRTSDLSPTIKDRSRFPQPVISSDDLLHHSQLLELDQLTREMQAEKTLHGLSEAPVTFPPTYKYSLAAQMAVAHGDELKPWQWANNRWPSWCDRILYLDLPPWMKDGARIQPHAYDALPLFPTSDHRAVALAISIPLKPLSVPDTVNPRDDIRLSPPFPIDPYWKSKRAAARTKEIIAGCLAYLGLTWEGNGFLLAATLGIIGGWYTLRLIFDG